MSGNAFTDIVLILIVSVTGIVGVTLNCSILKKGIRGEMFIYYTNLSNIAVIIYHLLLLISYADVQSAFHRVFSSAPFRFSVTLMIMLTFAIYHFVLRPSCKKHRIGIYAETASSISPEKYIGNLFVHYIVPILVLTEWLFSSDKNGLRVTDGMIWVMCPAIYMIFIVIRGSHIDRKLSKNPLHGDEKMPKKYPYPFIDIDMIGSGKVALNVTIIAASCAAIGCATAWLTIFLSA